MRIVIFEACYIDILCIKHASSHSRVGCILEGCCPWPISCRIQCLLRCQSCPVTDIVCYVSSSTYIVFMPPLTCLCTCCSCCNYKAIGICLSHHLFCLWRINTLAVTDISLH